LVFQFLSSRDPTPPGRRREEVFRALPVPVERYFIEVVVMGDGALPIPGLQEVTIRGSSLTN
jgi:hypothetical protein